jgi:hypothetical protein
MNLNQRRCAGVGFYDRHQFRGHEHDPGTTSGRSDNMNINNKLAASLAIATLACAGQAFAQNSGGTGGTSASGPSGSSNGYSSQDPAPSGSVNGNPEVGNSSTPPAGAPSSSLSPNAMTPRANQNGASLPSTMRGYTDAQRSNTAPPNAGATNPNAAPR